MHCGDQLASVWVPRYMSYRHYGPCWRHSISPPAPISFKMCDLYKDRRVSSPPLLFILQKGTIFQNLCFQVSFWQEPFCLMWAPGLVLWITNGLMNTAGLWISEYGLGLACGHLLSSSTQSGIQRSWALPCAQALPGSFLTCTVHSEGRAGQGKEQMGILVTPPG
jgi:hypothetical protein